MNTDLAADNISFYGLFNSDAYDTLIKHVEEELKENARQ